MFAYEYVLGLSVCGGGGVHVHVSLCTYKPRHKTNGKFSFFPRHMI